MTNTQPAPPARRQLAIEAITPESFAPFGTVMAPADDGVPFGVDDAELDLTQGTPRFYTMRIPGRGLEVSAITRHRRVTQALASAGGHEWVIAVAPPLDVDVRDAAPAVEDIRAFLVPGDTAIMLATGTWHAGPLFEDDERSFFNLELADTNIVDHHTCDLAGHYGVVLALS